MTPIHKHRAIVGQSGAMVNHNLSFAKRGQATKLMMNPHPIGSSAPAQSEGNVGDSDTMFTQSSTSPFIPECPRVSNECPDWSRMQSQTSATATGLERAGSSKDSPSR